MAEKKKREYPEHIQNVNIRMDKEFLNDIDELIEKKTPRGVTKKPSRHDWLIQAIIEKFERDSKEIGNG